jgi:hypothetical protein
MDELSRSWRECSCRKTGMKTPCFAPKKYTFQRQHGQDARTNRIAEPAQPVASCRTSRSALKRAERTRIPSWKCSDGQGKLSNAINRASSTSSVRPYQFVHVAFEALETRHSFLRSESPQNLDSCYQINGVNGVNAEFGNFFFREVKNISCIFHKNPDLKR